MRRILFNLSRNYSQISSLMIMNKIVFSSRSRASNYKEKNSEFLTEGELACRSDVLTPLNSRETLRKLGRFTRLMCGIVLHTAGIFYRLNCQVWWYIVEHCLTLPQRGIGVNPVSISVPQLYSCCIGTNRNVRIWDVSEVLFCFYGNQSNFVLSTLTYGEPKMLLWDTIKQKWSSLTQYNRHVFWFHLSVVVKAMSHSYNPVLFNKRTTTPKVAFHEDSRLPRPGPWFSLSTTYNAEVLFRFIS